MSKLLSRDDFRNGVFARDNHKCIICGVPAEDAHHIIERKLWKDGGYYLDNGASLCSHHHIQAEMTLLSVDEIIEKIEINNPVYPPHLKSESNIDKWGNPILPSGRRLKGELFFDESVQKILKQADLLNEFEDYVKYPRTLHVPWSPGASIDDRHVYTLEHLYGKEVIVTEKMDGENTTIYQDHYHARSTSSVYHRSRTHVGALQARIGYQLPNGWRVCGENLYGAHSIYYENLLDYFYVHSIWDINNNCLSWDDTVEWCELLELTPVPVLEKFNLTEHNFKYRLDTIEESLDLEKQEGYVIRNSDSFYYTMFDKYVAKWVRPNHVTTDTHFMNREIIPNKLR